MSNFGRRFASNFELSNVGAGSVDCLKMGKFKPKIKLGYLNISST